MGKKKGKKVKKETENKVNNSEQSKKKNFSSSTQTTESNIDNLSVNAMCIDPLDQTTKSNWDEDEMTSDITIKGCSDPVEAIDSFVNEQTDELCSMPKKGKKSSEENKKKINLSLKKPEPLNKPHAAFVQNDKQKEYYKPQSSTTLHKGHQIDKNPSINPEKQMHKADGKRQESIKNQSDNRNWQGRDDSFFKNKHQTPENQKSNDSRDSDGKSMKRESRWDDKPIRNASISPHRNKEYLKCLNNSEMDFKKVTEIDEDLFMMSDEYSLGHCVAVDMNMGSGIAVSFRQKFKNVDDLLDQRQHVGGLAVLKEQQRFIYYLVTKRYSSGKPTYETLWKSLQKMKSHIVEHNVEKLALPRIGCGLDSLEWKLVKKMIEVTFTDCEIEITICNFQQTSKAPSSQKLRKCHIVNVPYDITEIEKGTIILYFGSVDGFVTNEISSLDKKFPIVNAYKTNQRNLGEILRSKHFRGDYVIYGCIVRNKNTDLFKFVHFQNCLRDIQKHNRKDKYVYVGIQHFGDQDDDLIMSKIINLARYTLQNVDIYVCGDKFNSIKY